VLTYRLRFDQAIERMRSRREGLHAAIFAMEIAKFFSAERASAVRQAVRRRHSISDNRDDRVLFEFISSRKAKKSI